MSHGVELQPDETFGFSVSVINRNPNDSVNFGFGFYRYLLRRLSVRFSVNRFFFAAALADAKFRNVPSVRTAYVRMCVRPRKIVYLEVT